MTSYAELLALSEQYAASLARLTPPGAFVPIFANKSAESIACSLGCLASGRPFAWLNKRLRGPQIAEVVSAGNAECIVTDAPGLTTLSTSIMDSFELTNVRFLGLADTTLAGEETNLAKAVSRLTGTMSVEVIELKTHNTGTPLHGMDREAWACCLFTSGSTGCHKGVRVSDRDLLDRARSEADWYGLDSSDRLMSILPFSFDVGLNQLMSGLVAGACLVIQQSWLPKDLFMTLAEEKVTGISGVPAIWRDCLAAESRLDLQQLHRSLRYVTISGGSLSAAEQTHFQESIGGVGIFKTYGQTETFRSAGLRPEELTGRKASVGRAYSGTRVLIVDDALRPCPPGEVGEIIHIGAGTMMGYLGGQSDDQKLRSLPAGLGGARAVFTGDYGYFDTEGYLFLKGRRDRMIKIAGNRVYPEEVADQLRALDGIREAEAIALETAAGESRLVGFVVRQDGTYSTTEAVRQAAAQRLPAHMVPSQIVFLHDIPRLPNGKPDYSGLNASLSIASLNAQ